MEKYPSSGGTPSEGPTDDWVGSPEHFDAAKQNAAERLSRGDDWFGTPEHFEEAKDRTTRALKEYIAEDAPDHPWQVVAKRQLNPHLVGAVIAVASAAALTLDMVNSGPSSFVVNNPAAATTALAAGAAAIGGIASKLTGEANADELRATRQAERKQRKQDEEDKAWWK